MVSDRAYVNEPRISADQSQYRSTYSTLLLRYKNGSYTYCTSRYQIPVHKFRLGYSRYWRRRHTRSELVHIDNTVSPLAAIQMSVGAPSRQHLPSSSTIVLPLPLAPPTTSVFPLTPFLSSSCARPILIHSHAILHCTLALLPRFFPP